MLIYNITTYLYVEKRREGLVFMKEIKNKDLIGCHTTTLVLTVVHINHNHPFYSSKNMQLSVKLYLFLIYVRYQLFSNINLIPLECPIILVRS